MGRLGGEVWGTSLIQAERTPPSAGRHNQRLAFGVAQSGESRVQEAGFLCLPFQDWPCDLLRQSHASVSLSLLTCKMLAVGGGSTGSAWGEGC